MIIHLNEPGYEHAKHMILQGLEVGHRTNNWEEVQPTPNEAVVYLNNHGIDQYGTWFLGVDKDGEAQDRFKYSYPFGDFSILHESALLDIIVKATENRDYPIADAASNLIELIKKQAKKVN